MQRRRQLEHQVWGVLPKAKHGIQEFVAAFELSRWQFAEKLASELESRGFTKVKIITCEKPDNEQRR